MGAGGNNVGQRSRAHSSISAFGPRLFDDARVWPPSPHCPRGAGPPRSHFNHGRPAMPARNADSSQVVSSVCVAAAFSRRSGSTLALSSPTRSCPAWLLSTVCLPAVPLPQPTLDQQFGACCACSPSLTIVLTPTARDHHPSSPPPLSRTPTWRDQASPLI
jgi:hypothetical protein